MKNWKKIVGCLAGAALALNMNAQQVQGFVHEQSKATDYVWPTDPQVLEKLDKWVFVEWSRANSLVQDISYPTNMLFSKCL